MKKAARTIKPLTRCERIMVVADTHGELVDVPAARVAMDWAKHFKPTIRIHLGDGVDLGMLRDGAKEREAYRGYTKDLNAAVEFNMAFKPTHYLMGNHDNRLLREIESPNKLRAELAADILARLYKSMGGAVRVPWGKRKGVLRRANWNFVHGYYSGVNATRQHALAYGNVMHGHTHRVDRRRVERIDGAVGMSIGCLCQLDLDYNAGHVGTLAQEHGMAYGWITHNNTIRWCQAEKDETGQWYFPSEMLYAK